MIYPKRERRQVCIDIIPGACKVGRRDIQLSLHKYNITKIATRLYITVYKVRSELCAIVDKYQMHIEQCIAKHQTFQTRFASQC